MKIGTFQLLAFATAAAAGVGSPPGMRATAQEPTVQRLVLPKLGERASTVIEIESLAPTAKASAGQFSIQQMAGFGPGWGGGAQLFWGAPAPAGDGPRLTLRFEPPTAGVYDLVLVHTVAPDFGRFTLFLDGSPSSAVDGYHPSVAISRSVLGRHQLAAGSHELALRVTGKSPSSSGYFVGLDRLELTAAAGGPPAPGQPAITIEPGLVGTLRPPAPAPDSQVAVLVGVEMLASRPRLEARHGRMKCCPFRIEEDFDTRRVMLDWSSENLAVSLRWRVSRTRATQGRWEIFDQVPPEHGRPVQPLAAGTVALAAAGEWQRFEIDVAPLTPDTGPKLPSILKGARLSAAEIRPRLFVRVVPTDSGGSPAGPPSNALLLAFDGQTGPGKLKPAVGPLPTLSVIGYEPLHPYTKDFLCSGIATRDGLVRKGELFYLCQSTRRPWYEEFGGALVNALGQFVQSVGTVIDGVSAVYTDLKSGVVDLVAGVFAEIGCGDPCRLAVQLALDAALISAGVPPSLPDFEQALADLEREGIDAMVEVIAEGAVSQGVPGPLAEEAARQAVTYLVDEAKAAASSGGSSSPSADFEPDPSRAYHAGAFLLELTNPFDKPTAEVFLGLTQEGPEVRVMPAIPVGDGSWVTESVDVGGLRPRFQKIPPLAPGSSLRVELTLEPIPDPHRWLDLYYEEPVRLAVAAEAACGRKDPMLYCSGFNDDAARCEKHRRWADCMRPWGDRQLHSQAAALGLKDAFVDIYGPGNDTFTLQFLPNRGTMTINTSQGVAYVRYVDPTWQGKRVDTCLGSSQQCGEPVAQLYCNLMRYPIAVGAHQAPTLGAQTSTITLDTKQTCTGSHCRAFSEITCATAFVRSAPADLG